MFTRKVFTGPDRASLGVRIVGDLFEITLFQAPFQQVTCNNQIIVSRDPNLFRQCTVGFQRSMIIG